jgi:hypothetical protein
LNSTADISPTCSHTRHPDVALLEQSARIRASLPKGSLLKFALGGLAALLLSLLSVMQADANPLIGIGYEVWFPQIPDGQNFWNPRWGTPLLGVYNSADPAVIDQHAEWIQAMGVDFILIDWSNNIANDIVGNPNVSRTIIANTDAVFAEYKKLSARGIAHPKIAILLGTQNQGGVTCDRAIQSTKFREEIDHIAKYNLEYPEIYFSFDGKPLIVTYLGTPACKLSKPWSDDRFSIRWETGYLETQTKLYGGDPNQNTYWSWIDRDPIPSYRDGRVEAVTVAAAYPGRTGWTSAKAPYAQGRMNADGRATFDIQWEKAIRYDPELIFINQWNEFTSGEPSADEYTPDLSNDIEPTAELGCTPMKIVRTAIAALKRTKLPGFSGACSDKQR